LMLQSNSRQAGAGWSLRFASIGSRFCAGSLCKDAFGSPRVQTIHYRIFR
jgi:hypothetical protein